jgi:cytochrome P450
MIEAGSETTSQALNNTIIGLLSNPDAIRKAQAELDRVVGPDRTPTFEDEKSLPYIRAIVKVSSPLDSCSEELGNTAMETLQ